MNASGTWDFRPQQETFGREDGTEAGRGGGTLISSVILISCAPKHHRLGPELTPSQTVLGSTVWILAPRCTFELPSCEPQGRPVSII